MWPTHSRCCAIPPATAAIAYRTCWPRWPRTGIWAADREGDSMPPPEASALDHPLEQAPGLGPLARRSGGGTAAVVLAALAVYTHRRTGADRVIVGYRSGTTAFEIGV